MAGFAVTTEGHQTAEIYQHLMNTTQNAEEHVQLKQVSGGLEALRQAERAGDATAAWVPESLSPTWLSRLVPDTRFEKRGSSHRVVVLSSLRALDSAPNRRIVTSEHAAEKQERDIAVLRSYVERSLGSADSTNAATLAQDLSVEVRRDFNPSRPVSAADTTSSRRWTMFGKSWACRSIE